LKAIRRTIIEQLIIPKTDLGFNESLEIDWMQWMSSEYGGGDFFSDDEEIEIPDEEWEAYKREHSDDGDEEWLWKDFADAYVRDVPAFTADNRPSLDDAFYVYDNLSVENQREFLKKITGIDADRIFKGISIAAERM
jgi:hypothetical protein